MGSNAKPRVLVTGASGFIGRRLVKNLLNQGFDVTCLFRKLSKIESLEVRGCQHLIGDLSDDTFSLAGVAKFEFVFHLAALTTGNATSNLAEANPQLTTNLLEALAISNQRPVFVLVSSLAAVGPSTEAVPIDENSQPSPVSNYGIGKLRSEQVAREFGNTMPVSIIRPPIVLGQGDKQGLEMFRLVESTGWHFVPGFRTRHYSVIHVEDLVTAMIQIATDGERTTEAEQPHGIYHVSHVDFTYAELGRAIGNALGRNSRCLYVARPVMWLIAACNSALSSVTGKPKYLNLDKYAEAFAGHWTCSNQKFLSQWKFEFEYTFQERLEQTVRWYREQVYLKGEQHDNQHLQPT